jgi:hypothetical protein
MRMFGVFCNFFSSNYWYRFLEVCEVFRIWIEKKASSAACLPRPLPIPRIQFPFFLKYDPPRPTAAIIPRTSPFLVTSFIVPSTAARRNCQPPLTLTLQRNPVAAAAAAAAPLTAPPWRMFKMSKEVLSSAFVSYYVPDQCCQGYNG